MKAQNHIALLIKIDPHVFCLSCGGICKGQRVHYPKSRQLGSSHYLWPGVVLIGGGQKFQYKVIEGAKFQCKKVVHNSDGIGTNFERFSDLH